MMANSVEAILRHHRACFPIKFATPRKMIPVEINSKFAADGIQNPNTLWYHFLANAVAGNGRDTIALHWWLKIGRNIARRKPRPHSLRESVAGGGVNAVERAFHLLLFASLREFFLSFASLRALF